MSVQTQVTAGKKSGVIPADGVWITTRSGHHLFISADKKKGKGKGGWAATPAEARKFSVAECDRAEKALLADIKQPYDTYGNANVSQAFRGKVKHQIIEALSKKASVTRSEAQEFLDGWAATSGDHDTRAVRRQQIAANELGLGSETMKHLGPREYQFGPPGHHGPPPGHHGPHGIHHSMHSDLPPDEGKEIRLFNAEYAMTQAWFKKQGITHVTLIRGVGHAHGAVEGSLGPRMLQPLSSFTTAIDQATPFGDVFHAVRVPVSQVQATSRSGRGCLGELEYIVRGGPVVTRVGTQHVLNKKATAEMKQGKSKKSSFKDNWHDEDKEDAAAEKIMLRLLTTGK